MSEAMAPMAITAVLASATRCRFFGRHDAVIHNAGALVTDLSAGANLGGEAGEVLGAGSSRRQSQMRPSRASSEWYAIWYYYRRVPGMSVTASEARKSLFPLIKKVNEDHDAIEIVSKHGNAVLVSAEDFAALREGAYLLRSPANARRLLKAYENALNGANLAEHELIDPDAADPQVSGR